MSREKISVIIPIYKIEKYLKKCVDSIINQTYTELEIILVDDGSPDKCGEMCDEYAKADKRVKVIHKANGGLSDARNIGIENSTGDYILFLDGDDYVELNLCEKLYKTLKDNDADISICDFKWIYENGEEIVVEYENGIYNEVLDGCKVLEDKMSQKYCWRWIVAWNKLYKREIFAQLRYPKGKIHEDEFVAHKIYENRKVASTADKLIYYVAREKSIMSECRASFGKADIDVIEALKARLCYAMEKGYNSLSAFTAVSLVRVLMKGYRFYDGKDRELLKMLKAEKRFLDKRLAKIIPYCNERKEGMYLILFRLGYGVLNRVNSMRKSIDDLGA